MDEGTLGARLRVLRRWRGMTQVQVAGLAGLSPSLVSMIENGQRPLDRRSQIAAIAAALRVSETDLVGGPHLSADRQQADPHMGIPALRLALQANSLTSPTVDRARPLPELARLLTSEIEPLSYEGDAIEMLKLLAPLIDELHVHTAAPADEAAHRLALETLIEACYIAMNRSKDLGYHDLAYAAATRASEAARLLDEPVALGKAAFLSVQTMPRDGTWSRTLTAAERAAGELEPQAPDPRGRQVLGMLTLSAALAAASVNRDDQASDWLDEATAIAARIPDAPRANWGAFSATNVGIWRVAIAVEQGAAGGAVLDLASSVDKGKAALRKSRYATFLADIGRGLARDPKTRPDAIRWLHQAESTAPQMIRNSFAARETVAFLLSRARADAGGRELRGMASRMGVPH